MDKTLQQFRIIALLEGISFLVLLFIAMPLKYMMGIPEAVKIVGMLHGILFILFVIYLIPVKLKYKWTIGKTILAFLASLVPFGTFILDARILKKEVIK